MRPGIPSPIPPCVAQLAALMVAPLKQRPLWFGYIFCLVWLGTGAVVDAVGPSTILTVLIDDLGFADSSIQNSDVVSVSPNLHRLMAEGIRLDRHYTYKYCSPTRRSFLSGRFPVHITGAQAFPCTNYLPLNFTLFSEKLAKAGWMNHFIGKGHLSYLTTDHLPINRGFASHVGYLNAEESYLWGNSSATPPKAGKTQWLPSDAPNGTYAKDFWDGHAPGERT